MKLQQDGQWSWHLSFCHGNHSWSSQESLSWASTQRLKSSAAMW